MLLSFAMHGLAFGEISIAVGSSGWTRRPAARPREDLMVTSNGFPCVSVANGFGFSSRLPVQM